jgi:iduronate 2-sulfatase
MSTTWQLLIGSIVAWFGLATIASGATAEAAPNVLFIAVDDLRCELGCYGKSHVHSPNIDRLAERGMRFDRAYVQAAFCNPSRASFLTGLRPDQTKVLGNREWFRDTLPNAVTLPQLFKQNGYYTYRIGKIFHGTESMEDPQGWHQAVYPKGTDLGKRGEGRNLTEDKIRWCRWKAAEGSDEDQPDGQIAALAVDFLHQTHDRPFFLAVGFHKPHDPFVAPAKYFQHYPIEQLQLNRDPQVRSPELPPALPDGWKKEFDKFDDQKRREFLRAYLACISFVDAQIGKVLDCLRETGHDDDTIIVLVSDHGYHLGERGWWNKNTLFELTARTPMIVYTPEMRAHGKPCSRLVEFVDIYPTIADYCGLTPPNGLAGRSFLPLLDDPQQPWKEAAFMQLVRGPIDGRTVRTERWRYTEWDQGRQGVELYDHHEDPGEYHNLAANPEHADTVKVLRELLHRGPQ